MFVAIQLIIQMCTSLLRWQLNQALHVSQGSASTCFRWSGHFRHSFVKGLFRDTPSNFYSNRFIFNRQGAKNKLAQFFWDTVYSRADGILRSRKLLWMVFSRSYCYTVWSAIGIIMSSICPSVCVCVCLSVMMCTNRKSLTRFRLGPKSMTLDDLERPKCSRAEKNRFTERSRKI